MTLKETAITVAIAILFTTFILVGIDAFYPRPEYEKFCNSSRYNEMYYPKAQPITPTNCTSYVGPEQRKCEMDGGSSIFDYDGSGCSTFKECDYCNKEFTAASKVYSNNLFYLIAPLGALAIILGVYYSIEFLGSGFMFSGIILMFYGTVQNFSELNRYARVIVVFAELMLVLFIAYKKVMQKETKPKKRR